jgi:hypothetical protein
MIDDGDCGAIGGMKIGRGDRSTRRKKKGDLKIRRVKYHETTIFPEFS